MTAIIIDGVEKAGKTTLIRGLKTILERHGFKVHLRKWTGRAKPDDREYSRPLMDDTGTTSSVTIWDRSWASEYVYGNLLGQDRRLSRDPWLGAWLHDRAVQANGLRVMMLGTLPEVKKFRDKTDLPVDPTAERGMFGLYATDFGWMTFKDYEYTPEAMKKMVAKVFKAVQPQLNVPLPPAWAGPQDAEIVFVGPSKQESPVQGGWLPFSDRMSIEFCRPFGPEALKWAWTNSHSCPPVYLRDRKVIVACGATAHLWVRNYIGKENKNQLQLEIPSPSYLIRFKTNAKELLAATRADLNTQLYFKEN